jgi:3-hydroxy-9,10-secoandrosta-1,3,5(10)-triene-9,17-dione monooxygenase reductase component
MRPVHLGPDEHPFATPSERRDPTRRLRGRLVAPVTIWTAGDAGGGTAAGLTVASVLVAEGDPSRLLGLIGPTTDLAERLADSGAFVVHVLGVDDQALAERFAERRPPVQGQFGGIEVTGSPWGPVLAGRRPRAACRLADIRPMGTADLVEGIIEELVVDDLDEPLAWQRGAYRRLVPNGGDDDGGQA